VKEVMFHWYSSGWRLNNSLAMLKTAVNIKLAKIKYLKNEFVHNFMSFHNISILQIKKQFYLYIYLCHINEILAMKS